MINKKNRKKVFVALSGGVDSAVAAYLLLKEGYDVYGCYMRQYDIEVGEQNQGLVDCGWRQDRRDAMAVAASLKIPFIEWDFRKQYHEFVVDYLFSQYQAGLTPNPDVMCNRYIKFGAFLDKALRNGADYIATGHYVRIKNQDLGIKNKGKKLKGEFSLEIAKDKNKDQSYFLYSLTQQQLKNCLFPLANYAKPQVRKIALKANLPNAEKKDSQGVCFIGKISIKNFLQTKIKPKKGQIIDDRGQIVGTHEGLWYYTIGQRHGLGVTGGDNIYFVYDKDFKKNILYVAAGEDNIKLLKKELIFDKVNWIVDLPKMPLKCLARIRYRQELQACQVVSLGDGRFQVLFSEPQRAVTPGQIIVLYKKNQMLGGGIIN